MILTNRLVLVWAALIGVTVISYIIGIEHAVPFVVVPLGAAKAWLIFHHFMEIRLAPAPWQIATSLWCLVITGAIGVAFFYGLELGG